MYTMRSITSKTSSLFHSSVKQVTGCATKGSLRLRVRLRIVSQGCSTDASIPSVGGRATEKRGALRRSLDLADQPRLQA